MSNLYHILNSKRNAGSSSLSSSRHQPRSSFEKRQLDPLTDDTETDDRRYYRSTEFQQALLEEQIERSLTPPAQDNSSEDTGRFSRYRLSRRSTASKSSLSLMLFDVETEMAEGRRREEGETAERPPTPACDTVDQDKSSSANDSQSSTKRHKPRVHLHRIGPLINFARNRKAD